MYPTDCSPSLTGDAASCYCDIMTTTADLPVRTKAEKAWVTEGLCLSADYTANVFTVTSHNSPKTYKLTAGVFEGGALRVECNCVKGAIDRNSKVAVARCKHAAGLCRNLEASGMLVFDEGHMTWGPAPAVMASVSAA